jgi:DNA-binding GntR family transcriptional regulator
MSVLQHKEGVILPQGVYKKLRDDIITGGIAPGSTLREEHIAAQLKVSRTPVREALRKLAEEGFLEYQPHKGARLLAPTAEWVREIFQIREALEGIAAREAAVKIRSTRLQSIRAKFEELRPRVLAGDIRNVGGFVHEEVFAASGNRRLQRLMELYLAQVRWFQSIAAQIPGREERAFWEHEGILSALESGDPGWAENTARAHIRATMWDLLKSLNGPLRLESAENQDRAVRTVQVHELLSAGD